MVDLDALENAQIPGFQPLPGVANPHAQTLGGSLLRGRSVSYRRERLTTPDGDFLDLDIGSGDPDRVVLILHGLEGSSQSGYVREMVHQLNCRNMLGVAMNFRGCSGEVNRRARSYHSGETGDVKIALEWLREQYPDAPLGAVGYSLGGNVLLKLLGEWGDRARTVLGAAAVVSVPYDLAAGADRMERGLGYFYSLYFLPGMIRKVLRKE